MRTFVLSLALCALACGGSDTPIPTAPSPPPVQACQANSTAAVSFRNDSRTTTQDIFWDGLRVATLTPGQTIGAPITAAAGATHRLEVRITNTATLACTVSTPVPAVCSTPLYTCAFP